ncbi:MAG: glycoside hydrolase family 9 protein [Solirubrobacteraceae bacterium]
MKCALLAGLAAAALGVAACGSSDVRPALTCAHTPSPRRAAAAAPAPRGSQASTVIRLNQVGFAAGCGKQALGMSTRPLVGAQWTVRASGGKTALTGRISGPPQAWSSAWPYVYAIDFSALTARGRYSVAIGGSTSPAFRIDNALTLYAGLADNAVRYFQAQRDGPHQLPGALARQPSHLLDAAAAVHVPPAYSARRLLGTLKPTGAHVDASGGWFDAGDYLKFVETSSFNDVMMLMSLRDYPQGVADQTALRAEARFGVDWLLKMWDARQRVLFYQVGIGDGNGKSVLGDHDFWRLPQRDDALAASAPVGSPAYFVSHRPAFVANAPGGPISANLAGRVAAALALCAQVFAASDRPYAERCDAAARQIYAQAQTHPGGQLLSTSPHVYYPEDNYSDDLALGGVELYLSSRALHRRTRDFADLTQAGRWLDQNISSPSNGRDSLNLYDLSSLASFDIVRVLRDLHYGHNTAPKGFRVPTDVDSILSDQRDQLNQAQQLSAATPFGLANPATNRDTVPHALGYAVQARLYDLLTSSSTFEALAETQLDWVLGQNAWGSSFVVGAGTTFPHCLAHQIANLSGSLNGRPPLLLGATVDGPNDPASLAALGAPDGYRPCTSSFAAFDNKTFGYADDARSADTSEPSNDYVALSLMAFAQESRQG